MSPVAFMILVWLKFRISDKKILFPHPTHRHVPTNVVVGFFIFVVFFVAVFFFFFIYYGYMHIFITSRRQCNRIGMNVTEQACFMAAGFFTKFSNARCVSTLYLGG